MTLLSLIIPIIYSLFTGVLGVTINLMFPVLNWDSEVVVVKQSISALLAVLIGGILVGIPIMLALKLTCNKTLTEDILQDILVSAIKNIDRYYSEKLDASNSDELKLKEVLDTMSKLDCLNDENIIKVDIESTIDKGDEARFNRMLKVKTIKFLIFASIVGGGMVYASIYFDMVNIIIIQGLFLVVLLLLNLVLTKKKYINGEV